MSRPSAEAIRSDRVLLLVEGDSDQIFVQSLLRNMSLDAHFQFLKLGGKDELRKRLIGLYDSDAENIAVLGVIIDADRDARARFQSIRDSLQAAGFVPPAVPLQIEPGIRPVGVYLMPAGNASQENTGSLETLWRSILEEDTLATKCIEDFFICAQLATLDVHEKNWISAYQAIRNQRSSDYSRDARYAFQSSWWTSKHWEHPALNPLHDFLKRLAETLTPS